MHLATAEIGSKIWRATNIDDPSYDFADNVACDGYINNYKYPYGWVQKTIPETNGIYLNNASMAAHNGRFVYSAYTFYSSPVPYIAVGVSQDSGESWTVERTPIGWNDINSTGEDFDGNPADWAERFTRQNDKFEPWEGLNP